jgi:hypothetical protein
MTTIHDAYINALLADATYALTQNYPNGVPGDILKGLLTERMTLPQATYIANNFTMVTHVDSSEYIGSGFDATVWKGKVGTSYEGKTYVSITGSEGVADFVVDADLALNGAPRKQLIDMVNWWLKITTPQGVNAMQIFSTGGFILSAAPVEGTGQLTGVNSVANVEVNGHSLGGYLASAFARLFGRGIGVASVGWAKR